MAGIMAEKWHKIGKVFADDMGNGNVLYCYRPKLDVGSKPSLSE